MYQSTQAESVFASAKRLRGLAEGLERVGSETAVFLVFDHPSRVEERPGLVRAYYEQRCLSIDQVEGLVLALREVGVYVDVFSSEIRLVEALASGRLQGVKRARKLVYNGIEGGIAIDGFAPGRKALLPALCDAYGIACSNSNAYACALARHKHHYSTILRASGLPVPRTWHYFGRGRWANGLVPARGVDVIAKSTYESWSVGVTESSRFKFSTDSAQLLDEIVHGIGQPVTLQEFVPGDEIEVSVLTTPERILLPPIRSVLSKAPFDPDAFLTIDDNMEEGRVSYEAFDGDPQVHDELGRLAIRIFDCLELDGFGRVDFRVDAQGRPWAFDVGVSPAICRSSSSWAACALLGLSYSEFLRVVLAASLASKGLLEASIVSPELDLREHEASSVAVPVRPLVPARVI